MENINDQLEEVIEDDKYLSDLENLYGNSWVNLVPSAEDIDRLFEIFRIFYVAGKMNDIIWYVYYNQRKWKRKIKIKYIY